MIKNQIIDFTISGFKGKKSPRLNCIIPSESILKMPYDEFRESYNFQLEGIGFGNIINTLLSMTGGEIPVLVTENKDDSIHYRGFFTDWMNKNGIKTTEL